MPRTFLDHLAVTADSLAAGASYVFQTLGVYPQVGGEHPRMGTHNLLLRLGDTMYLEVIAPNPAAVPPARPRWFGLDRLSSRSRPSLSSWVIRTNDMLTTVAAASEPLGAIESMSRGELNWSMTIPADGSIPLDGIAPALIAWDTDIHPAAKLEDQGLKLIKLELAHPNPNRVSRLLDSLALDAPVSVIATPVGEPARLTAQIDTPNGLRVLSGQSPAIEMGAA